MAEINSQTTFLVIGAGPAGLYGARELAAAGAQVIILNRDIKPGGLAEYGIYYDKHKMKDGLRKQFRQILDHPNIHYFGNVTIGESADISLNELLGLSFQAVLVAVGAQGTKWLGIPGEELKGTYHAKDIVYHYNSLPPYSQQAYPICCRVALVGVGNVMMDIAHWTIRELKVDEVIAVARRGPAEVKFTKKEMEIVARNLDLEDLDQELERVRPVMEAVGQDVAAARENLLSALPKALEPISDTRFRFEFLASPTRVIGDDLGHVCGLEIEDTTLIAANGDTKARGLGTHRVLDVDMVVFCIGDRVDERFGLPVYKNEYVKNPNPRYPVDGISFETFNPQTNQPIEGLFVAGWSREASSGLVGLARKDGENGARAMLQYFAAQPAGLQSKNIPDTLQSLLNKTGKKIVTKQDVHRLEEIEQEQAQVQGMQLFKFKSNEDMLDALGLD